MRASGATTNSAMLSAGRMSCLKAAHHPSTSPARRKSISRKPRAKICRDQLPGHHRSAEIAAADIVEIQHQLLWHRLVEPHLLADHLDLLLAGIRSGGEEHRRIARQHPHQKEREDEDAEQ